MMEVFDSRLRMQGDDGVLELFGADRLDQVASSKDERVADPEISAPDRNAQGVVGRQAVRCLAFGHQQPRRAHQVGARIAAGGDVELVVAHYREGDADRTGYHAAALASVAEPSVGGADRLLEHDRDACRLVVVVLAPDLVGDETTGIARSAAYRSRRDDQVEAALGARLRARGRLGDDQRVRRIGKPVILRDEPIFEREPRRHRWQSSAAQRPSLGVE